MKRLAVFLVGAAALVTGQQLSLPACAQSCVTNAISETGCDATDIQCICTGGKTGTDIGSLSQSCVTQTCSAADVAAATAYYEQICASGSTQSQAPTSARPTSLAPSTGTSGTAVAAASTPPGSSTEANGGTAVVVSPTAATGTMGTGSTIEGASSTGSSVRTTPTAGTVTSSGDSDSEGATSGGSLSTGAKAGIAVGAVLAAVAIALLAFFLVRRSRRRAPDLSGEVYVGPPELGNTEFKGYEVSSEQPKYGPVEMATTQPHVTGYELDASPGSHGGEVAELAAMPVASMPIFFPHDDAPVAAHTEVFTGAPGYPTMPIGAPQGSGAGEDHSTSLHAAPAPAEAQGAIFTTTDPSAAELEQMLKENDELEQRRKTLEELKALQDQQAALKERIKAAQARSAPGS